MKLDRGKTSCSGAPRLAPGEILTIEKNNGVGGGVWDGKRDCSRYNTPPSRLQAFVEAPASISSRLEEGS